MNFDTVITIVLAGVGIGVVVLLTIVYIAYCRIRMKLNAELSGIVDKLAQERLIALTVEVDNNQYFCYNALTKDFVCQGYTLKEIIERFRLRYPNKSATIYDGDEIAVQTLKKQMDQLEESNSVQS